MRSESKNKCKKRTLKCCFAGLEMIVKRSKYNCRVTAGVGFIRDCVLHPCGAACTCVSALPALRFGRTYDVHSPNPCPITKKATFSSGFFSDGCVTESTLGKIYFFARFFDNITKNQHISANLKELYIFP